MTHTLAILAYTFHVGAGMIALITGSVALIVRKGGLVHRRAGKIFVMSMAVMAIFAGYLAVTVPDQLVNLFIAVLTLYLLATAWMAVHQDSRNAPVLEKIALLVSCCLCAPFVILSFQLATGLPPLFKSALPFKGAILIAMYSFTAILLLAVIGDARVVFSGGICGNARIARHLWRMCLGLTFATGSAFTNGFARLLPGPYHVPAVFFYPQFIPLACWLSGWCGCVSRAGVPYSSLAPMRRPASDYLGPYCISPLPNDQSSRPVSTKLIQTSSFRTPPFS